MPHQSSGVFEHVFVFCEGSGPRVVGRPLSRWAANAGRPAPGTCAAALGAWPEAQWPGAALCPFIRCQLHECLGVQSSYGKTWFHSSRRHPALRCDGFAKERLVRTGGFGVRLCQTLYTCPGPEYSFISVVEPGWFRPGSTELGRQGLTECTRWCLPSVSS